MHRIIVAAVCALAAVFAAAAAQADSIEFQPVATGLDRLRSAVLDSRR